MLPIYCTVYGTLSILVFQDNSPDSITSLLGLHRSALFITNGLVHNSGLHNKKILVLVYLSHSTTLPDVIHANQPWGGAGLQD